jgi:4-amino-4-deoxy-L-arabinose transferase-like glycosyltransferase
MKAFFKNNKAEIFFSIILLVISLIYGYKNILSFRPYSCHQWRQTDCLSLTMNYYKENRNFFEPAIHSVGTKDGKTISEFPIIYFFVTQLWKIFGYHEYIFRLLVLFIVLIGLFCLFKLIEVLLSNSFYAAFVTLFLFSSPVLAFFSISFLADAPAFGIVLIACYFYWKSYTKKKKIWFYLSLLFFLLSGLIKISSLLIFIALFIIHIYTVLFSSKNKVWFHNIFNLIPYIAVLIIIFAWYTYAANYNRKNLSGIFLQGILPIWDVNALSRKQIWTSFHNNVLPSFFNELALYCEIFICLLLLIFYKKVNKFLLFTNFLVLTGGILYFILFYQVFNGHEYYMINLLIFIPLPVITILEMIKREYPKIFESNILKIVSVAGLIILIYIATIYTRMEYDTNDIFVRSNVIVKKSKINYWKWYHWQYTCHYKPYETITPYLRSLGLKRTDRVYCLPDESINITLYLMDQKGFTAFGGNNMSFKQKMEYCLNNGVKFLILDSAIQQKDYFQPYIHNKIGSYKNIYIYKLK